MPGHILTLNEFDTYRLGLIVERYEGASGSAALRLRTQAVLVRAGQVLLSTSGDYEARTLFVTGMIEAATVAQARANLEQFAERLSQGRLELRFSDRPERVLFAHRLGIGDDPLAHQVVQRRNRLRIELQCLDAYTYTRAPTSVGLTAVRAACALGTAPSAPVIQLMGSATSPIVTYRRADGAVAASMTFTGLVLAATDFLAIDADAQTITRSTNGIITDAAATLTAGDFFALNPNDGGSESSGWPTLEVSSGTGVAFYRRSFV